MRAFSFDTLLLVVLALLPACGSDDEPFKETTTSSLADPDNVRAWANTASAYAVYGNVYKLFAVADGDQTFDDPGCPGVADDGTTLSVSGGCTDSGGITHVGSAEVTRSADGDRSLTLNDFGTDGDPSAGEAHLRVIDEMTTAFSVNLTRGGVGTTTFAYEGRVEGSYDTPTIWNGSGTVTRDGNVTPQGTVEVTTTDEVIDNDSCAGQPLSGNTTIHNQADQTAIVTYDGAVDCDDEHAASYSLDGTPKGKLTGISCSLARGPGEARGAWTLLLTILIGFAMRSRRMRRNLGSI
jgi:hypothetical protein